MSDWRTLPAMWLWNAVRADEPASMEDLVHRLGWTAPTIVNLLPALVDGGLVVECGEGRFGLGPVDPWAGTEMARPDTEQIAQTYQDLIAAADAEAKAPEAKVTKARGPGNRMVARRRARVNLTLPPALISRAMVLAARNHLSLSRAVEAALARWTGGPMTWQESDLAPYMLNIRYRDLEDPSP